VSREVEWWLQHRAVPRLFIVVAGGDIAWNRARNEFDWERTTGLPPALKHAFPEEPLFVDLRSAVEPGGRVGTDRARFRSASWEATQGKSRKPSPEPAVRTDGAG
jgi:hypothetical protein